ncbi:hypothetical protein PMI35_01478 [Pseudomonas sp. GM78]|nr:hypothetical protein PMI35_01478 [Pseudomonas sp. GM78]
MQYATEMFEQLIKLTQCGAPVPLSALHVVAQLPQHFSSIRHRMRIDLISPCRSSNRQNSPKMGQVIASSLRLNATALLAHTPERKVHQPLAVYVGVNGLTKIRRCNGIEGGFLGLAQRSGFLHFDQVSLDHVLDGNPLAIRSLNRTRLIEICLTSTHPGLSRLFSGEGLALLVDLHSVALDADLSRVAHCPIRQFSCPDSRHIESGTRQF